MLYQFTSFLILVLAFILSSQATAAEPTSPKQLLLISFDGAGDNALWERSRDFAQTVDARFTYFLSCTLVIPRPDSTSYKGPHHKAGRSNIGFAQDVEEVRTRLTHIWKAKLEGHEIASHTCGHFDGADWTKPDWVAEMTSFRSILSNAWASIDAATDEPEGWKAFVADIDGFRAPYLSAPDSLFAAERSEGFTYDASTVSNGPTMPVDKNGVMHFGLPLIPEGPRQRPIIAMDYNLFVRHSSGVENSSRADEFEERAYSAFRAAFDNQYKGKRIPLQIGLHFVEMNGGAYWRAMERLVSEVCGLKDVGCVTYAQALQEINTTDASQSSGF